MLIKSLRLIKKLGENQILIWIQNLKKANIYFEKDFYKLINNSLKQWKHLDIRVYHTTALV